VKVCVVGLGYIGFPTACLLAQAGHSVLGVDVNSSVVHVLNNGGLHITNENGLQEAARSAFASGNLRVADRPEAAQAFILAVQTPLQEGPPSESGKDVAVGRTQGEEVGLADNRRAVTSGAGNGAAPRFHADLASLEQAARDVSPFLSKENIVAVESTVPPGTTRGRVKRVLEESTGLCCGVDFYLAHAPERVLPGRILDELVNNPRLVGGVTPESTEAVISFYSTFVRAPIIGTDATTAEFVKVAENTFRDVNIALANEFAVIAEDLGVDVFEAIALANRHPRVNVLKPGPGVGGHCIAVDPYFLVGAAPEKSTLIQTARSVNQRMPIHVLELFDRLVARCVQDGKPVEKVAVLGAAYKANVGDERESPALLIAGLIEQRGYRVVVNDPHIARLNAVPLSDALQGADILALLTDHDAYSSALRPDDVMRLMRQPRILDCRGFFDRTWDAAGFTVVRLGVGKE